MPAPHPDAPTQRLARFTPRPEDVIAAQSCVYVSRSFKPIVLAAVLPPVAVFLLVALFLYVEAMPGELWRLMIEVFLVVIVGCGIGSVLVPWAWMRWYIPRAVRRAFREQRSRPQEVVVTWDTTKLYLSSEQSDTRIAFADYLRWAENRDVALLFQSKSLFQILPKRVLDPAQLDDLRSIAGRAGLAGAEKDR